VPLGPINGQETTDMRSRRQWLIATNITLAASIGLVAVAVPALGVQPASRARGQYTMVAGELRGGGESSGIYVIDSINEEIVVLRWNESKSQLDGLDYRSLQADLARQGDR
jgi:hypothetical protein